MIVKTLRASENNRDIQRDRHRCYRVQPEAIATSHLPYRAKCGRQLPWAQGAAGSNPAAPTTSHRTHALQVAAIRRRVERTRVLPALEDCATAWTTMGLKEVCRKPCRHRRSRQFQTV